MTAPDSGMYAIPGEVHSLFLRKHTTFIDSSVSRGMWLDCIVSLAFVSVWQWSPKHLRGLLGSCWASILHLP